MNVTLAVAAILLVLLAAGVFYLRDRAVSLYQRVVRRKDTPQQTTSRVTQSEIDNTLPDPMDEDENDEADEATYDHSARHATKSNDSEKKAIVRYAAIVDAVYALEPGSARNALMRVIHPTEPNKVAELTAPQPTTAPDSASEAKPEMPAPTPEPEPELEPSPQPASAPASGASASSQHSAGPTIKTHGEARLGIPIPVRS